MLNTKTEINLEAKACRPLSSSNSAAAESSRAAQRQGAASIFNSEIDHDQEPT